MAEEPKKSPLREIIQPFIDLVRAPRALWGINLAYFIEGLVYFGILNYLAMYFNRYAGLNDMWAGWMVMILTAGITISMFFFGGVADRKGVRFALLLAFVLMLVGRCILSAAPVVDPKYVDITEDVAGRNDPVFVFTDAKPLPAPVVVEGESADDEIATKTETEAAVAESTSSNGEAVETAIADSGDSSKEEVAPAEEVESPSPGIGSKVHLIAIFGILLVVLGYGMYQPGAYAAVRHFTTAKTSAMGYAMLYALMNLGGWIPTYAFVLRNNDFKVSGHEFAGAGTGILGVYWVYTALTVVALLATYFILSKKTVEQAIAKAEAERRIEKGEDPAETPKEKEAPKDKQEKKGLIDAVVDWVDNHPIRDAKFAFFIFCLIPVQTLFAHNWMTLPMYVERAFRESWPWISKNFEPAVNFNPLLIFILVPIVTAITQKRKIYNMMILGTFIMAAPTFLLTFGAKPWTLVAYLVIMTVGEAMWQPRFLQYAAEIAPEGRTGAYMGVAQFPWFLTKMIVPIYSGWFLLKYCPEQGEVHSETMWFIYACIAMCSTIMLILAKGWLGKDFKSKAD